MQLRTLSTQLARLAPVLAWLTLVAGCPDPNGSEDVGTTGVPDGDDTPAAIDAADVPVVVPDVGCTSAAQCVAAATGPIPQCLEWACEAGECALADRPDGSDCNDDDYCTVDDTCQGGACVNASELECDDGNPCTTGSCDPQSGCVTTYNQKACDDGSVCTVDDRCFQGECQGEALLCDDNNDCTDDSCDPVTGCMFLDNAAPCSDGDACTAGDLCAAGVCVPGPPLDCGDDGACVDATCDPALGCIVTPLDGACDDENACTENDTCKDGACYGDLIFCDDLNSCTNDYCDTAEGCIFTDNIAFCEDGDPCTLADQCAAGVCVPGVPDPYCCETDETCDDGDACTDDSCVIGYCHFTPVVCDDGFACTEDACVEGLCLHTPYGPMPSGPIIEDGFEGALDAWMVVSSNAMVTWQPDDSTSYAGAWSLYCGNIPAYSYDFEATKATISRTVSLPPGAVKLTFWLKQELEESPSCTYDVTRVLINGQIQYPEMCSTVMDWELQEYSLDMFSGTTVTVAFDFDTLDSIANAGAGVWIDDLVIKADAPEGCCLVDADCDGDGTCLGELCHPEAMECAVLASELACDDDDPCTDDSCLDDGTCVNAPTGDPDCCSADADCPDDDVPCTVPVCVDAVCGFDDSACGEPDPELGPELEPEIGPEQAEPLPEQVGDEPPEAIGDEAPEVEPGPDLEEADAEAELVEATPDEVTIEPTPDAAPDAETAPDAAEGDAQDGQETASDIGPEPDCADCDAA